MLFNHLAGLAPIAKFRKDPHGWGREFGSYSQSKAYQRFVANYNVPISPKIWNYLWKCSTLPKIEMFISSLMHERVLTGENLEKGGFDGPFCCPLCAEASENISHLFLKCPYAISIWKDVLKRWGDGVQLPDKFQACFLNWENLYHGELNQKNGVRACWLKLPKIICWCIWNRRNHRIFQGKIQPAWKTAIKVNALFEEVVSISKIPNKKENLTDNKKN